MFNEVTFREVSATYRPNHGKSISQNVTSLNVFLHDVRNLSYYEH